MPYEKIIERYERALNLVKDVVPVCDICHIYDNSEKVLFRIFKKEKSFAIFKNVKIGLKKI